MPTATRDTIPWRLRDGMPLPTGALTVAQMEGLASQFEIAIEHIQKLSQAVNIGLAMNLNMTQPEFAAAKRKKGVQLAQTAAKDLERAENYLARAIEAQQNLRFRHLIRFMSLAEVVSSHRGKLAEAQETLAVFRRFLEVSARDDSVWLDDTPDRRKVIDMRRRIISVGIFNCWLESDRELRLTTDTINKSARTGALVDFVNAIVLCITDPPTLLSSEMIRVERDDFQAGFIPD